MSAARVMLRSKGRLVTGWPVPHIEPFFADGFNGSVAVLADRVLVGPSVHKRFLPHERIIAALAAAGAAEIPFGEITDVALRPATIATHGALIIGTTATPIAAPNFATVTLHPHAVQFNRSQEHAFVTAKTLIEQRCRAMNQQGQVLFSPPPLAPQPVTSGEVAASAAVTGPVFCLRNGRGQYFHGEYVAPSGRVTYARWDATPIGARSYATRDEALADARRLGMSRPEEVVVETTATGLAGAAGAEFAPGPDQLFGFNIGDIGVTTTTIVTPNGSAPLAGSQWIVSDQSRTTKHIPTWAIVLAIGFALACLLGLLFLLVKEQRTSGYVEVNVQSGALFYCTQIPVSSPLAVDQVRRQVAQAQSMALARAANYHND